MSEGRAAPEHGTPVRRLAQEAPCCHLFLCSLTSKAAPGWTLRTATDTCGKALRAMQEPCLGERRAWRGWLGRGTSASQACTSGCPCLGATQLLLTTSAGVVTVVPSGGCPHLCFPAPGTLCLRVLVSPLDPWLLFLCPILQSPPPCRSPEQHVVARGLGWTCARVHHTHTHLCTCTQALWPAQCQEEIRPGVFTEESNQHPLSKQLLGTSPGDTMGSKTEGIPRWAQPTSPRAAQWSPWAISCTHPAQGRAGRSGGPVCTAPWWSRCTKPRQRERQARGAAALGGPSRAGTGQASQPWRAPSEPAPCSGLCKESHAPMVRGRLQVRWSQEGSPCFVLRSQTQDVNRRMPMGGEQKTLSAETRG